MHKGQGTYSSYLFASVIPRTRPHVVISGWFIAVLVFVAANGLVLIPLPRAAVCCVRWSSRRRRRQPKTASLVRPGEHACFLGGQGGAVPRIEAERVRAQTTTPRRSSEIGPTSQAPLPRGSLALCQVCLFRLAENPPSSCKSPDYIILSTTPLLPTPLNLDIGATYHGVIQKSASCQNRNAELPGLDILGFCIFVVAHHGHVAQRGSAPRAGACCLVTLHTPRVHPG